MTAITTDREVIRSMLSSARLTARDPYEERTPELEQASAAFVAVLEEALAAPRPADHEDACQRAWAASIAARDAASRARWGVDPATRSREVHDKIMAPALAAVAALRDACAALDGRAFAASAIPAQGAMARWAASCEQELPGDAMWWRLRAVERGYQEIRRAWDQGVPGLRERLDPKRHAAPSRGPLAPRRPAWRDAYADLSAAVGEADGVLALAARLSREWDLERMGR